MTTTIDIIAIGQELPMLMKEVSQRKIDAYSTVRARSIHTDEAWARAKGFKPVHAGDRPTVHGVVKDKRAEGAATRVVVDVRCVNQDGATTAVGAASGVIR